ncbi:MORN repeat protein, putative [Plasmodium malariae]|uniref:MORN repeat protein, putative n=2 Tax=Plasmodium (Plasmodium) TaxID=418103 RepID=A0A1A8XBE7_PLAMA|nr:MORN repeat protein, putative [Plasmodium malariae]SBT01189.1 conserved Plasmodium protein, unknown function [Plasmodium malariae]SCN44968.1 MORN repeat protein, putative [Plasmodium malariae]
MKKLRDSLHIFLPKNKRPSDNNKNEITGGTIYEIGNEIEEIFQEDVENIKFKADDISSFFVKNSEIEEEEEKKEFLNYDGYKTNLVDDNCNNNTYEDAKGRKTKTLFDPSTCGPYVCCVVILSKKENIQIEFIHPNIHDINEGEILFKSKQNKNKIKKNNKRMITPFNVWYRYKGDWKEDVKMLILERMYLFKEVNTKNFLCNFSNNKSISNNNEYNILYGLSGNRYYIIALNYLEDNKCKEIMIISQVPYFDFIYKHFLTVMQSYIMEKKDSKKENNEIMEEEMEKTQIRPSGKDKTKIAEKEIEIITMIENKKDKSEIFANGKTEITVNNKTAITAYENTKIRENRKDKTESKKKKKIIERNYKVLEQFIDTFGTHSTIFDKISFNDYYVNLGKDIEELNNMKIKNILIFLKAVLLEKKIAMLCSKKGKGCKMLLLFLSFIPDIINFGFNIKNYERNFEKWEKLKLPLILFHEKYILLLHINNLELFNEYAFEKNYLISTNIESDVYNFVKNDLDLFYDIDTDELVIKNKNLIDALTLTRYENNYLKKIHSFFTYFFNFSSLFFENIKQNHSLINGKNVGNILNPLPVEQDTPTFSNFFAKKGDKSLLMDVDKNGTTNCSVINARNGSDICKGNDYHCAFNEGNCDNKTSMSDDAMGGEGIGVGEGACPRDRNILQGNALKNRGISGSRIGSRTGSSDNSSECYSTISTRIGREEQEYEYIDDEDEVNIINTKSVTLRKSESYLCPEISENKLKNIKYSDNDQSEIKKDQVEEKYITDLRNHFHNYFKDFFLSSKENFEEGIKEKKEEYESNYNMSFLSIWQETKNYNFFIEKDCKINKFLKIAEQNNVLFDKKYMEDYKFVDDLLIIEKKRKKNNNNKKEEIDKNLKDILLISLKGYIYEGTYCILKKCKQGLGKFVYNIYDITFHGEWENDQINGSGHLLYNNKFKYFGNFKNNLFNGNGLYVDNLLNQYEGEFLNGSFNGNGKLIFNKNTYIGIFKNSNLIGKGKILYQNGLIYTGEIKDFLPHGYGFLSYNSSTVFEGYFLQGKKNGNGFLTINNNSTSNEIFCIEGKWNNDKPVLKKNFNVLFPNKDKYIGKIYILSSNYGGRSKCRSLNIDDTISENINRNMFEVKKLIANKIAFIKNQDKLNIDETLSPQNDDDSLMDGKVDTTHKDDVNTIISADTTANVCSNSNNNNSSSSRSDSAPSFSSCNILKGKNAKRTEDTIPILTEGKQIQGKHYHHHPPSDEKSIAQHAKFIKKTMLKKKLETIMKTKEKKLMKKFFEILDRSWMYNTERKLKNNKEVVEYLQQKNLFLIPHREGICIIHNKKKKENYDGKFCLGMKHGYGISVYDNVNRYEGYWYRGMKHGYGILYEGDNIYYVHFNYDKLIEKQKILHEQLSKYKPKKETSDVVKEYGNHFIINQPFFDYRNFLSSTLCNYL